MKPQKSDRCMLSGNAKRIQKMSCKLVAEERVTLLPTSNQNQSNIASRKIASLGVYKTFKPDEVLNKKLVKQIPDEMMHSFKGRKQQIVWQIEVEAKIKGRPDIYQTHEIAVYPF